MVILQIVVIKYGRFDHLSTKITRISKHYDSLESYVFLNDCKPW